MGVLRRRIVLVGATGRVGRAVVAEMDGADRVLLVGRDDRSLADVAAATGFAAACTAGPDAAAALGAVLHAGDVVLSAVGPYDLVGDAVVEAAIAANATYLDVAAEATFLDRVHHVHGPAAARRGLLLVPGCGAEGLPGLLVAEDAVQAAAGDGRAVEIAYLTQGVGSALARGSRALAQSLSQSTTTFHRGHIVREHVGARRRSVSAAGGRHHTASIGGAEVFALPRHHPQLTSVDVHAGWFGPLAPAIGWSTRLGQPLAGTFRALGGDRVLDQALRLVGEGPATALADGVRRVVAEVRDADGVVITRREAVGGDPVVLTARLASAMATHLAGRDVRDLPTGAVDPLTLLGRDGLRDLCSFAGLTLL